MTLFQQPFPEFLSNNLAGWRRSISLEPSVNNKKDPVQLN